MPPKSRRGFGAFGAVLEDNIITIRIRRIIMIIIIIIRRRRRITIIIVMIRASGAVLEDDPQRLAFAHKAQEPEDVGVVHLIARDVCVYIYIYIYTCIYV